MPLPLVAAKAKSILITDQNNLVIRVGEMPALFLLTTKSLRSTTEALSRFAQLLRHLVALPRVSQ